MNLRTDGAVDDPGLEAGVGVAKMYRGCHDVRVRSNGVGTLRGTQPVGLDALTLSPSACNLPQLDCTAPK
jgi:hypothetical protein